MCHIVLPAFSYLSIILMYLCNSANCPYHRCSWYPSIQLSIAQFHICHQQPYIFRGPDSDILANNSHRNSPHHILQLTTTRMLFIYMESGGDTIDDVCRNNIVVIPSLGNQIINTFYKLDKSAKCGRLIPIITDYIYVYVYVSGISAVRTLNYQRYPDLSNLLVYMCTLLFKLITSIITEQVVM